MNYCEQITNEFIKIYESIKLNGLINKEKIINYIDNNIHSLLQYNILKSCINCNLIGIPEVKIKFSQPLKYSNYDIIKKTENKSFNKIDIAVYNKV